MNVHYNMGPPSEVVFGSIMARISSWPPGKPGAVLRVVLRLQHNERGKCSRILKEVSESRSSLIRDPVGRKLAESYKLTFFTCLVGDQWCVIDKDLESIFKKARAPRIAIPSVLLARPEDMYAISRTCGRVPDYSLDRYDDPGA